MGTYDTKQEADPHMSQKSVTFAGNRRPDALTSTHDVSSPEPISSDRNQLNPRIKLPTTPLPTHLFSPEGGTFATALSYVSLTRPGPLLTPSSLSTLSDRYASSSNLARENQAS